MKAALTATTLLVFLGLTGTTQATVLTFDFEGLSGDTMPQDYGDNVSQASVGNYGYGLEGGPTPAINVAYAGSDGNELQFWSTGFNDLDGVIFNPVKGAEGFNINFRADPGFEVVLEFFELGNRSPFDAVLPAIMITNELGAVLYALNNIDVNFSGGDHLNFGFGPDNLVGEELNIFVATGALGGRSDEIGLDNIRFGQREVSAVPVPPAFGLMLAALLGLVSQRRVRSR